MVKITTISFYVCLELMVDLKLLEYLGYSERIYKPRSVKSRVFGFILEYPNKGNRNQIYNTVAIEDWVMFQIGTHTSVVKAADVFAVFCSRPILVIESKFGAKPSCWTGYGHGCEKWVVGVVWILKKI